MADLLLHRLLHPRQFVLGPDFLGTFKQWQRIEITPTLRLTAHPDLDIHRLSTREKWLALLGFILDPDDPAASNDDILAGLMHTFTDWDGLFDATAKYGGRWLLVAGNGRETRLLTDALGLRPVYYACARDGKGVWCSSQPAPVARSLGSEIGIDRAAQAFIDHCGRTDPEPWLPGDASPYREVKHLLPNHYLNLGTGVSHRYWPMRGFDPLSPEAAVEGVSRTLIGLMVAASRRFRLALGLTAGWDSRLVLAACRGIADRVSFVTVRRANMSRRSPDLVVPGRLLRSLGLHHVVIPVASRREGIFDEFARIFRSNATFAHETWLPDTFALFRRFRLTTVNVNGGGSEVARGLYRHPMSLRNADVTPAVLARAVRMDGSDYAIELLGKWLSGIGDIHNLNVRDLFYWEQRVGRWLAMAQSEFDIAWQEQFTPYNCRRVLVALLSVSEEYRNWPDFDLYRKAMLRLWPDVLKAPINPQDTPGRTAREVLRSTGLWKAVRPLVKPAHPHPAMAQPGQ